MKKTLRELTPEQLKQVEGAHGHGIEPPPTPWAKHGVTPVDPPPIPLHRH